MHLTYFVKSEISDSAAKFIISVPKDILSPKEIDTSTPNFSDTEKVIFEIIKERVLIAWICDPTIRMDDSVAGGNGKETVTKPKLIAMGIKDDFVWQKS